MSSEVAVKLKHASTSSLLEDSSAVGCAVETSACQCKQPPNFKLMHQRAGRQAALYERAVSFFTCFTVAQVLPRACCYIRPLF